MLSMPLLRHPLNLFVLLLVLCPSLFAQESILEEIKKRAETGNAFAQMMLGQRYATGNGVPKDEVEAAKWYRKAALLGDGNAQSSLGHSYANGAGVPKDVVEAYAWFNISAVKNVYGKASRDLQALKLTPEEKARAEKRSRELFEEIEAQKKAAGK
jgi:TPR repeat protein